MYLETNDNVIWVEIVLLYTIYVYGKTDRLFVFVTS